jgi:hypothetical protein
MPAAYPEAFERELACTEAEWLRWLPPAIGARDWELGDGTATVGLGDSARLHLAWQAGAPRVIALLRLPRLQVAFRFKGPRRTSARRSWSGSTCTCSAAGDSWASLRA